MNKVILIGRLTKEPDVRYTQTNNQMVVNFTLAVNRNYVKAGEERKADFPSIVAFGKTAEFVSKYVTKGQQIGLCGRIQTRSYDDENGQKHYVTEVIAEEIDFADSYKKNEPDPNLLNGTASQNTTQVATTDNSEECGISASDDDLPF